MIRITDTPKPRDRFGSIPIREGKPANSSLHGPHLSRRPKKSFLWTWLKRTVGLLLGLAILLGLGSFLLVPYLATAILPGYLASALNRPVTIARGEFSPLTATLTLHQLIVGPQLSHPDDPVDPLLSAGTIAITLDPKRLLDGEVACILNAEHCFLHLVRQKDGGYNLGQALADLLPAMPVLPLRFSCDAITLSDSRLVFDDGQTGTTHLAEELFLASSPGPTGPMQVRARINGIPLALPDPAGSGQVAPLAATPDATEHGGAATDPAASAAAAAKTAEALALIQELSQAAGQYLQQPISQPDERRPIPPLAP